MKGSYDILRALAGVGEIDLWIGAISFEPRCLASLRQCQRAGVRVKRLIAFEYTSAVTQSAEDHALRRAHRAELEALARAWSADGPHFLALQPYDLKDAQIALRGTDLASVQIAVIDVSCMTKLHTIALAESFAHVTNGRRTCVVYARPENYGTMTDGFGWSDTLVAPLTDRAPARRDPTDGRGIVIPGHEADRLRTALSALPIERGLILMGDTPERRDFRMLSERRNGQTLFLLSEMHAGQWARTAIDTRDLARVEELTRAQIEAADAEGRAIVIYPFGPKPLVFEVARALAATRADASWFVYPVPHRYDIAYSAGDGLVTWYPS